MTDQEKLLTLLETVATNDKERWIFQEDGFVYTRIGLTYRVYDYDNNELHFDDRENACKDVCRKLDLMKRIGKAFNQSYEVTVGRTTKEGENAYFERNNYVDVIVNGESMQKEEDLELNPDEEFIELIIAATVIDDDKAQRIKSLIETGEAAIRDVVTKRLY